MMSYSYTAVSESMVVGKQGTGWKLYYSVRATLLFGSQCAMSVF
jgi:hypothetical protein